MQLIIEKIADAEVMEVDDVDANEQGKMGFGSGNVSTKRSIHA